MLNFLRYSLATNIWTPGGTLNRTRRSHLIVEVPNLDSPDNAVAPFILGNKAMTEILDVDTDTWEDYRELPDPSWSSTGCVVAYAGKIYRILNDVQVLDPSDFTITNYGDVPEPFGLPGKCASLEIDGGPGKK